MSEPTFPPELIESIRERAQRRVTPFQYVYPSVTEAVLRESGHAEIVAALTDVTVADVGGKLRIGVMAGGGCWSVEVDESGRQIFEAWKVERDAALLQAGAAPRVEGER